MDVSTLDFCTKPQLMWDNLVKGGVKYIKDHPRLESFVIGESGGIDSALTTALARAAIDKSGQDMRLIAYALPILTNECDEMERAYDVGTAFCDHFTEVDLSKAFTNLVAPIDNSLFYEMYGHKPNKPHDSRIRAGNIKARLRMMYLYDKAAKYKGLVLSTDNLTEYLLGFWTLHGDVGDFGFIQELWKTEVYNLTHWYATYTNKGSLLRCYDAKPTDGLGISDSDLSQLLPEWKGTYRDGYEEVDDTLITWIRHQDPKAFGSAFTKEMLADDPVVLRHLRSEFKRKNPANLPRETIVA